MGAPGYDAVLTRSNVSRALYGGRRGIATGLYILPTDLNVQKPRAYKVSGPATMELIAAEQKQNTAVEENATVASLALLGSGLKAHNATSSVLDAAD